MSRRTDNDMEDMVDTIMSPTNSSVSSRGGDAGVADVVDLEDLENDDLAADETNASSKRKRRNPDEDDESDEDSRSPKALARKSPSSRDQGSSRTNSDDDRRSDEDRTNEERNKTGSSTDDDEGEVDDNDEKKKPDEDEEDDDDDDRSSRKEDRDEATTPRLETPNADVIREPPPVIMYYCATQGCRSVDEFECLNKIEEGAYGVVYRAKDKKTNEIVALKRLKMEKEKEGFPITSLREVDILLKMKHPNIVTVREIVVGNNMDKIYMAMDYVEHDLKSLMQHGMKKPFMTSEVKTLMQQLLSGIAYLHDNWVIHRDLKTSNLLLSHKGILKIADFGLAREYGSPLKEYTPVVVTLWYRSPELLLNTKKYSTAIDMWSVGCIFGELMLMKPLFNGKNEKDQLDKIFKDLGTPNERVWPDFINLPLAKSLTFPNFPYNTLKSRFGNYLSAKGFELINKLLTYDPSRRISAEEALRSEYFKETPLPVDPSMFPTWPAKSEGLAKPKLEKDSEPRAPSAGKLYEQMVADEGFVLRAPGVLSGFNPK